MAEEEIAAEAEGTSPAPAETHKRKHDDLEQQQGEEEVEDVAQPPVEVAERDSEIEEKERENEEGEGKGDDGHGDSDAGGGSEAKRPRLDAPENGHQAEQPADFSAEDGQAVPAVDTGNGQEPAANDEKLGDDKGLVGKVSDQVTEETNSTVNEVKADEQVSTANYPQPNDSQRSAENTELGNIEKSSEGEAEEKVVVAQQQEDLVTGIELSESEAETTSRKLEVPNNKVGVLIGKGGETIRFLQHNSRAKIQITKDGDTDPRSTTRPVELVGTLESIDKAEKLIKDVIAEADAGGSPALVARGFPVTVADGAVDQVEIQVPNDKVGFIIGKGGETIKSLQTRSGARIQLIPQHFHDGDQPKGRTIRVSGDRKQIEIARELINEIMAQPMRSSQSSHYSHRARGSDGALRWGSHGSHADHCVPYEYQNWGHYQSQYQHYSPYGGHNPRSTYGSSWEQRPQHMQQQGVPHAQSGSYNYYGGQGHGSASNISSTPHSQANYNYGPPRGADYGHQQTPHSQTAAPHQQTYGQGQNLQQQPYGGLATSHPGSYPDSSSAQGYGYPQPHQQFNRQVAPPYGVASQVPAQPQSYAQPTPSGQTGNMQYYQASVPTMQYYAQNVPQQQAYPYASSGYAQATYAQAPAPAAADGYTQVAPGVAAYPQQGYAQPAPAYSQTAPVAGAYGQYLQAQQQAYSDQTGAVSGYGYQQAQVDQAYAQDQVYNTGVAAVVPQGYAQPAAVPTPVPATAPNQVGYDQSGSYAGAPTNANASAPATAPTSAP